MIISEEALAAALNRMRDILALQGSEREAKTIEVLEKIEQKDPTVRRFIGSVVEAWKENPPPTPGDGLGVLIAHLLTLALASELQEEINDRYQQRLSPS